jgi:endonuclease I
MKKLLYTYIALFCSALTFAQIPAYYNDVDLTLTGMALKGELATKITNTHNYITYSQVWDVLKVSDLNPENTNEVLLVYGYDDNDGIESTDRTRNKNSNGGATTSQWNREHVFAKSIGEPDLGSTGPGADAHNLKPSDVDYNGTRGNKKFASGTGNSGAVGANWYPGDEWKGDVARIVMYMYVRYNTQCKPGNMCNGNPVSIDLNMVDLLLQWNIDDPVNDYEKNRNNTIANSQGNRNPFIDNPYLATIIWGGADAQNFWPTVSVEESEILIFSIFPNPTTVGATTINTNDYNLINTISVFDITGKNTKSISKSEINNNSIVISDLEHGVYFIRISTNEGILTKKVIVK